jgi:hypothetical protein
VQDDRGLIPAGAGKGFFLFASASRLALRPTQPRIHWVPGALSFGIKRPECEAGHLRPSTAEGKNAWNYTSTPQYVFMTWHIIKDKENLPPPPSDISVVCFSFVMVFGSVYCDRSIHSSGYLTFNFCVFS